MTLQFNNTDQVYTPGNTGCTSIIVGSFSLALNYSPSLLLETGAQDIFGCKEQLIRRAFSRRNRFRFVHPLQSTMLPFSSVPVPEHKLKRGDVQVASEDQSPRCIGRARSNGMRPTSGLLGSCAV